MTAVGRRFDGTYRDENGSRAALPRVSMWSLWNEPNQGGWLSPQWENGRPASPALFRKLYQSGYAGLVATGHRADNDIILLGETAPLGSDAKTGKSPMRPKQFLRELFAGDLGAGLPGERLRPPPLHEEPVARCSAIPHPDSLTMANIDELGDLLDQMAAATGKVPSGLPLYMTEYGFETNPPDPFSGISYDLQAKYNTLGEYLAYLNPRIALAGAVPARRRPAGAQQAQDVQELLVHLPVRAVHPARSAQAGGVRLPVPVPRDADRRRPGDRRADGPPLGPGCASCRDGQATTVRDPVEAEGRLDRLGRRSATRCRPTRSRGYFEADRIAPARAARRLARGLAAARRQRRRVHRRVGRNLRLIARAVPAFAPVPRAAVRRAPLRRG